MKLVAEQNNDIIEDTNRLISFTKEGFDNLANVLETLIKSSDKRTKTLCDTISILTKKVTRLEEQQQRPDTSKSIHDEKDAKKEDQTKAKLKPKLKKLKQSPSSVSPKPTSSVSDLSRAESSSSTSKLKSGDSSFIDSQTKPRHETKSINKRSAYLRKPRILVVADSLVHNADNAAIEKVTNTRITTKLYRSDKNIKNVSNVTLAALEKANSEDMFTHVMLGVPSIDITNQDTSEPRHTYEQTEQLKEKVSDSCQKVFEVAKKAITTSPTLKKVVIMEHLPRYGSLEAKLVKHANKTMAHLVQSLSTQNIIQIGKHNLKIEGYTSSILNIISTTVLVTSPTASPPSTESASSSYHSRCPQARYQEKQRMKNTKYPINNMVYSVPACNAFDMLGN